MEMTKKIYLETLKSVLRRSILHYWGGKIEGLFSGTFYTLFFIHFCISMLNKLVAES